MGNNSDNKDFKKMRLIIVILSIIIVLMFLFIFYLIANNNNNVSNNGNNIYTENNGENDGNEKTSDTSNVADDATELDDYLSYNSNLKIDKDLLELLKKITINLGDRENPLFDNHISENSGSFVQIALNNTETHEKPSYIPSTIADYDIEMYVNGDDLRKTYKDLFNAELQNTNYSSCPYLLYDAKTDIFYGSYNCGGTGNYYDKYIYDYKVEDDYYYYVYVAYQSGIGTGDPLGPSNYNKARKYELYFEKNNGTFTFMYSTRID